MARKALPIVVLVCLLRLHTGLRAGEQPEAAVGERAERLFARKVWPLLREKCLACHGDDAKKLRGGLDLRSRAGMLKGGDSGKPALVPDDPDRSPLFVAVTRKDADLAMPPKENDRLSAEQVEWLRRWIADGAPWPSAERVQKLAREPDPWEAKEGVAVATSGGLSSEWTNRKYRPEDLWAYRSLRKLAVPKVEGRTAANPIDAFLDHKFAALGLTAAPPADRPTLIRRVTFDLTGLPPTPEEVESFVRDPAPDEIAFGKVIDRLLASPHYGEQWGRHWLDVVRYADSSGFANDYERGNAWRYRDYVVRSFNADKPYDQFIREQLAGDEIDPKNPEMLVAVGFLRLGPWELTGMEVPKVARQRFLDDVTDAVGQVFLGHPLQCARCHDHKFDPVPTRDYYSLQAVFATTQLVERDAPFLPSENQSDFDEIKYLQKRKADYEAVLKEIDDKEEKAARKWCSDRGLEYVPRREGLRKGVAESKLPPRHAGLDTRDLGMERIARKGLERLRWELDRYQPVAHSVYSGRTPMMKAVLAPLRMPKDRLTVGELEATAILGGGDPFSPKEKVTPGTLSASPEGKKWMPLPDDVEGRREGLAAWIANRDNPLTARVMVNRVWQWHFGQGIAGNPNNFGATGKKPTHPELLDWLAVRFIEEGWSVKAMHRLILTSEAYRRSSNHPDREALAKKDPTGSSYAVFRPRRLTAEELRDSMLAVSGELNRGVGGIPVRPEMNPEAALQPRQVMGTFAPAWEPSPLPRQRHRRSLYALRLRGLRDPFFEVFNQPSPENSCELREASTVTPQVFGLFNSQASHDRALAFAERLLRETRTREEAVGRAFRLAFGREASAAEVRACLRHWDEMTERQRRLTFEKPKVPREVVREAVEENTGERFTFTEALHASADFVPDRKPADMGPEVRALADVCLVLLNTNEFIYLH